MNNTEKSIIFFDGHCTICNFFVTFMFKIDKKKKLYYAPLQGKTADKILTNKKNNTTVIFYTNKNEFVYSTALIKILEFLDFPWRLVVIFYLIPRFIRDTIYKIISKYRYLFFKQKKQCRIPTKEESKYFLP